MSRLAPAPSFSPGTSQETAFLEGLFGPAARPQPRTAGRHVAVIGTGCWGKDLARTFAELGALRAVCDSNPMALAAMPNGTVKHYSRIEDCLADPEISGVAIATPAGSHFELVRSALMSGKDVFVEKPLALNARDGRSLVVLAAASNRILMVGNALRYHPAVGKLLEMIDGGEMGKVEYICSTRQAIDRMRPEENILWSLAPYDVSVVISLLGEMPVAVSCQGGDYVGCGVSDVTVSQLMFAGGVRAQVFVSHLSPLKEQRLVVVGSEQMAIFDQTAPNQLVTYPRHDFQNPRPTAAETPGEPVSIQTTEPRRVECQAFLDSLETRRPPVADGRHELRELEVFDACVRSLSHDGMRTALRPPTRSRGQNVGPSQPGHKHVQPAGAGSIGAPV